MVQRLGAAVISLSLLFTHQNTRAADETPNHELTCAVVVSAVSEHLLASPAQALTPFVNLKEELESRTSPLKTAGAQLPRIQLGEGDLPIGDPDQPSAFRIRQRIAAMQKAYWSTQDGQKFEGVLLEGDQKIGKFLDWISEKYDRLEMESAPQGRTRIISAKLHALFHFATAGALGWMGVTHPEIASQNPELFAGGILAFFVSLHAAALRLDEVATLDVQTRPFLSEVRSLLAGGARAKRSWVYLGGYLEASESLINVSWIPNEAGQKAKVAEVTGNERAGYLGRAWRGMLRKNYDPKSEPHGYVAWDILFMAATEQAPAKLSVVVHSAVTPFQKTGGRRIPLDPLRLKAAQQIPIYGGAEAPK